MSANEAPFFNGTEVVFGIDVRFDFKSFVWLQDPVEEEYFGDFALTGLTV